MNNELKPCPFCGGDAKCEQMMIKYRIHCDSDCTGYRSNKNNAIEAWNKRLPDEQITIANDVAHKYWQLIEKYKKLLAFVKRIRNSAPQSVTDGIAISAFELLKEIGEE